MGKIGKILCYGKKYADEKWRCDHFPGIHRLYLIHAGSGGCRHRGRDHVFRPGFLYYIPFSEDFRPFSNPEDPILHTYVDFERIPPIVTDEILSADPEEDDRLKAAAAVFEAGMDDKAFDSLFRESVLYITSFMARRQGVGEITDPTVLKALTRLHEGVDARVTVERIAAECFMTPDGLIRRFRKAVGVTPYAYGKSLRLNVARYLRNQGFSLEETAARTGYADASSLLHALKKDQQGRF